ncbi:DeoR/GlpR family DNA-binding transcription regulator [Ileibacterium valens]|uniref:DeoR/GlpR family DNA-binding transcription regulator n=1 Tax=Ileibacterium valens TaxID=1862668 RepID=UPI00272DA913|nr:DeoR/GlpR family DNA-binding transcription regulator [Ileibacterium valens]
MIASQRLEKITEIVERNGFASTRELAKEFRVTEVTIRKDLDELERQKRILKVYGGAKSLSKKRILTTEAETLMADRTGINYREKDALCKYAANLVNDGDCIFIDGGTTFLPFLKYLEDKKVKIVSHNQMIVDQFNSKNGELIILGGTYLPYYKMCAGPMTVEQISKFNFDYAFISCAGIDVDLNKAYTAEMDTAEIKKMAIRLAEKSFLMVDSSKLNVRGFYSYATLDEFVAVLVSGKGTRKELPDHFVLLDADECQSKPND